MKKGTICILSVFLLALTACSIPKAELGEPCHLYGSKTLFSDDRCDGIDRDIAVNNAQELVGKKVLLITDNQQALIPTKPIFEQSNLSERTINTAHRRPSLDAFSLDIMNYMIRESHADLIVHGGDLLNNSCVAEFKQAEKVLQKNKIPWFVVPGNHDGYYLGVSSPTEWRKDRFSDNFLLDESAGWESVCTNIGSKKNYDARYKNYANKATFGRLYLRSIGILDYLLVNQGMKKDADLSQRYVSGYKKDNQEYLVKCIDFPKDKKHKEFMTNVCWTEHPEHPLEASVGVDGEIWGKPLNEELYPWMNFIVQRLEIEMNDKRTQIILIDTASYEGDTAKAGVRQNGEFRLRTNGAADAGYLSRSQREVIDRLFVRGMDTIIFGHHPLYEFERGSFAGLASILASQSEEADLRYVSGDTHDGYNVKWPYLLLDKNDVARKKAIHEINLGSTLDAPIEYALFGRNKSQQHHIQHYSLTPVVEKRHWAKNGDLKKTSHHNKSKQYVEFDNTLWDGVCAKTYDTYQKGVSSRNKSDPLLLGTRNGRVPFTENYKGESLKIPQAGDFLGLPYLYLPAIWDVRTNSLRAYKINRLIDLTEVYLKALEQAGIDFTEEVSVAKKRVVKLKEGVFRKYMEPRYSRSNEFNHTIESLSVAINLLEEELEKHKANKKVDSFMLCSALYDAEREYKASFLESIKP